MKKLSSIALLLISCSCAQLTNDLIKKATSSFDRVVVKDCKLNPPEKNYHHLFTEDHLMYDMAHHYATKKNGKYLYYKELHKEPMRKGDNPVKKYYTRSLYLSGALKEFDNKLEQILVEYPDTKVLGVSALIQDQRKGVFTVSSLTSKHKTSYGSIIGFPLFQKGKIDHSAELLGSNMVIAIKVDFEALKKIIKIPLKSLSNGSLKDYNYNPISMNGATRSGKLYYKLFLRSNKLELEYCNFLSRANIIKDDYKRYTALKRLESDY